jgi:hypothetical protein
MQKAFGSIDGWVALSLDLLRSEGLSRSGNRMAPPRGLARLIARSDIPYIEKI